MAQVVGRRANGDRYSLSERAVARARSHTRQTMLIETGLA